jgi:hypothetical protein
VLSRAITPKRRGRRPLTTIAIVGVVVSLLAFAGTALAVHDLDFQLDGDTSSVAQNNPNAPDPAPAEDWETLFNANGTPTDHIDFDATTGFNDGAFVRDFQSKQGKNGTCSLTSTATTFCTVDTSTFATGSKDTLDIPDWQCNKDNNVNSKIDIMNAYAAQFIADDGDQILYFGLEKNVDNGSNNVAFWFVQNPASCTSSGGAVDFDGAHADGDVLVVSAFTNGGGVSNIDAYRWDGTADCIDNPDNPAACDGLPIGSGGDCKAVPTDVEDSICATTNSGPIEENDAITTAWLTANGTTVGHTVVPPDFFEGGINLTEAFEGISEVPSCFSTFLADTRSSPSLTATLFDFAAGQLGGCESTLTTSAAGTASGSIGTGTVNSGSDTATLTIDGTDVWAGTMTWYLCGPVTTDGCDDTGVLVTTRDVNQDSVAADFVSGTATLTSVGRYCWTAHFEPDADTLAAGVDPADDDGANECFNVAAVTPTLSTTASCSANPCVLGSTLSDTATLSGTAAKPGSAGPSTAYPTINPTVAGAPAGGSITWQLFAPGCVNQRTPSVTSATVSGNGTYGPTTYTTLGTDPIGTYTFVANYGGSSPNTNAAATNTCASPGANETVTVIGTVSSATQQRWLPNDRIVLNTNGGTLNGTLTATLYSGSFSGTAANCTSGTATAVPNQQYTFDTSPGGVPDASGTVYQTTNTGFFVGTNPNGSAAGANGTYFWLIHYDDANLTDPADRCEMTAITVTD